MRNVLLGLVLIGAAVLPKIDGQLDLGDANHLASGSDAPKRPLIQLASGSDAPKRPLAA